MVGLAHNEAGALAHERDRHRVGAHALARDAAGGVARVSGTPIASQANATK